MHLSALRPYDTTTPPNTASSVCGSLRTWLVGRAASTCGRGAPSTGDRWYYPPSVFHFHPEPNEQTDLESSVRSSWHTETQTTRCSDNVAHVGCGGRQLGPATKVRFWSVRLAFRWATAPNLMYKCQCETKTVNVTPSFTQSRVKQNVCGL